MNEIIKIAILHAHNTLNYGSMMMCENAIHYLTTILPNVHFYILSDFVEETHYRLTRAINQNNFEVKRRFASYNHLFKTSHKASYIVNQIILRYRNVIQVIKQCNAILVLGGDDLSEYYGIPRLIDILLRLNHLKKTNKKLYLLGQSIGPIHSWRIPVAAMILKKVDKIYHRGPNSYRFVTEILKLKHNSYIAADLAFLDLPRQNAGYDLTKLNIKPGQYMTFVPSNIWSKYANDYISYLDGIVNVAQYLAKICEKLGMSLVLLPHVLRKSNDRLIVKHIMTKLNSKSVFMVNEELLPYEARAILASSYFVVTQRMHGAISSLQTGVPAVSLSYSAKYSDVIGNYLGLPQLVVELDKQHFVNDIKKVYPVIHSALQDLRSLRYKILSITRKAKDDALIQIQDLAKDLKS